MAAMWSYGRRLTMVVAGPDMFTYDYNADGIRTTKTVNGVKHTYALSGTTILNEEWTENGVQHLLMYVYDANGSPVGMVYRNSTMSADATEEYLFVKNIQGDILYVYNSTGNKLVSYVYDAWGNIISTTYSNGGANTAAKYNPFRYRGYYYDAETGLYYVSSRYYDPEVGRWINADNQIAGVGGEVLGYNMFAYCMNNPVNMSDPSGSWPKWATKLVAAVAIVAVVAVVAAVTVATAGAGTAIAAVAVGAAKGAAIGFAVGAATGAAGGAISHRISTGSWDGAGEAALNGMANGALSGAVSGAITGGITGGLSYNSGATSAGKGFDTYRQLKNEIGSPGAGNEWHHIVEQSQISKSGFSPQMIQNTNNIMSISKTTHRAISGYYSSVQPFTNGMIVRNWLAGQSFNAQYEFGINVIKMFM